MHAFPSPKLNRTPNGNICPESDLREIPISAPEAATCRVIDVRYGMKSRGSARDGQRSSSQNAVSTARCALVGKGGTWMLRRPHVEIALRQDVHEGLVDWPGVAVHSRQIQIQMFREECVGFRLVSSNRSRDSLREDGDSRHSPRHRAGDIRLARRGTRLPGCCTTGLCGGRSRTRGTVRWGLHGIPAHARSAR